VIRDNSIGVLWGTREERCEWEVRVTGRSGTGISVRTGRRPRCCAAAAPPPTTGNGMWWKERSRGNTKDCWLTGDQRRRCGWPVAPLHTEPMTVRKASRTRTHREESAAELEPRGDHEVKGARCGDPRATPTRGAAATGSRGRRLGVSVSDGGRGRVEDCRWRRRAARARRARRAEVYLAGFRVNNPGGAGLEIGGERHRQRMRDGELVSDGGCGY